MTVLKVTKRPKDRLESREKRKRWNRFLELLRKGVPITPAAHASLLDPTSIRRQIKAGREEGARWHARRIYREVAEAEAAFESMACERIVQLSEFEGVRGIRALQWYLSKRFRKRWGEESVIRHEHSGKVQLDLTKLSDEELERMAVGEAVGPSPARDEDDE